MQTAVLQACVASEMKQKRTKVEDLGSKGCEALYLKMKKGGRDDSHRPGRHGPAVTDKGVFTKKNLQFVIPLA